MKSTITKKWFLVYLVGCIVMCLFPTVVVLMMVKTWRPFIEITLVVPVLFEILLIVMIIIDHPKLLPMVLVWASYTLIINTCIIVNEINRQISRHRVETFVLESFVIVLLVILILISRKYIILEKIEDNSD